MFTNHSSEKIQNQRLFNEHFIQYHSSHFYTKKAEKKVWMASTVRKLSLLDIKEEKANCKSLTKIERMSKENTTVPQVTLNQMQLKVSNYLTR